MDKSILGLPFDFPSVTRKNEYDQESVQLPALWLAIVFPKLELELYSQKDTSQVLAVIEHVNGRSLVRVASTLAEKKGVVSGMKVSAAYALTNELKTIRYNPVRLKKKLQQLAVWAGKFTPKVNLQPPHALLLEIQGSLKLYGGAEALRACLGEELQRCWGYNFNISITPTPIASLLLANYGENVLIQQLEPLRSALAKVSINALPITATKKRQLHNIGARVLRDLWRLPGDALARRFGRELQQYLEQSIGNVFDIREEFRAPDVFESAYDLPYELNDRCRLLQVSEKLFTRLEQYLWERDLVLHQCVFNFHHYKLDSTRIDIRLRYPCRDKDHLLLLLDTRLSQVKLEAPVVRVSLEARHFAPYEAESYDLFGLKKIPGVSSKEGMEKLLQQLQIRLGPDAVQSLCVVADHRPEYAVQYAQDFQLTEFKLNGLRPLWLLPAAEPLATMEGKLWYRGPLCFVSGPERIESGWWSGSDVRRDYYIAVDKHQRQLWIYKELGVDRGWYLHGLFA